MATEWARVINTTTSNYLRQEEVNILRNRMFTAILKEKGRITYNWTGKAVEQPIRWRRVPIQGYGDMQPLTFPRQDRWKVASLDWRGYSVTDAVSKKERLMNQGPQALVSIFSGAGERLKEDMEDQWAEELYIDGGLAANALRMHGLESFLTQSGTTNMATGFLAPSQTYAGISTVVGNYGGSWSGSWPDGRGDASYDFWSPIIISYVNTAFDPAAGSANTWKTNGAFAMRTAIIKLHRNKGKKGQLDFIQLEEALYRQFAQATAAAERIIVNRGQDSQLVKLGFRDTINLDGTDVSWEYGMPANTGYAVNCSAAEIRSLQEQLFVADGPDWDPVTKSWRFSVDFMGNAFFNPRCFGKLTSATS